MPVWRCLTVPTSPRSKPTHVANADDHATRLELAKAYAAQGRFREALEAALEVVRRDRFFDQGAGRTAILSLFEALNGEQYDDLVREFRRKLGHP